MARDMSMSARIRSSGEGKDMSLMGLEDAIVEEGNKLSSKVKV